MMQNVSMAYDLGTQEPAGHSIGSAPIEFDRSVDNFLTGLGPEGIAVSSLGRTTAQSQRALLVC